MAKSSIGFDLSTFKRIPASLPYNVGYDRDAGEASSHLEWLPQSRNWTS